MKIRANVWPKNGSFRLTSNAKIEWRKSASSADCRMKSMEKPSRRHFVKLVELFPFFNA